MEDVLRGIAMIVVGCFGMLAAGPSAEFFCNFEIKLFKLKVKPFNIYRLDSNEMGAHYMMGAVFFVLSGVFFFLKPALVWILNGVATLAGY